MAKRCIGINIGSHCLSAVQLLLEDGKPKIEKVFDTQTRRKADSPAQLLRALFQQHEFDCHAEVAVSIPHESVYFRTLRSDSANLERLHTHTSAALENDLPLHNDQIIAQVCSDRRISDDKYSLLAAAMDKDALHNCLNILEEAKVKPDYIEPAILAVHRTIALNYPQAMDSRAVIAYLDDSHLILAVTENKEILIVRNVPITSTADNDPNFTEHHIAQLLSRETEITWQKIFEQELPSQSKVYIATKNRISDSLHENITQTLTCSTVIADPDAGLTPVTQLNTRNELWIAKGLALSILIPNCTTQVNFLQADQTNNQTTINVKKELMTCGALIIAIAVVSCVGLFTKLATLEAKNKDLNTETRDVFNAALPHVQNIVSPVIQIDQELQSLQKEHRLFAPFGHNNMAPMTILAEITRSIPTDMKIQLEDLIISSRSIRIRATCDLFATAYQWQSILQEIPGLELAEVQDNIEINSDTGIVNFSIIILSKAELE
jgi:Tfp pilus assembly PilM family ATPase